MVVQPPTKSTSHQVPEIPSLGKMYEVVSIIALVKRPENTCAIVFQDGGMTIHPLTGILTMGM